MKYKLSELFDLQMGKTPERKNAEYWEDGCNKWISIADLSKTKKHISETKECITDVAVSESGIKMIPQGTVVMSFKLSIGKVAITSENMYSNEAIMSFIDKGIVKIDVDYLYYLLMAQNWDVATNKAVMGKTLNKATLSEVEIRIHDYDEQIMIKNYLDEVNAVIEEQEDILSALDTLIKSRFVEMFGDVATGNYKYKTKKLGDVADIGSSHRVFTTEFVEDGIPFYRGTEIGELSNGQIPTESYYISEEHYLRLANDETKPKVGDLLMPSICNKGQVWMVDTEKPFYYKDGRVLCISPNRDIFNTRYLEHFMRAKTLVEYPKLGSGSTFAEFKIFLLKDIDVLIPPRELQNDFENFVAQVDKLKFS